MKRLFALAAIASAVALTDRYDPRADAPAELDLP